MNHPNQLDIYAPRDLQKLQVAAEHVPTIDDLKHWRDMDLLELLELFADLVKSDQWQQQGTTRMLLEGALGCDLPSSLTVLLLNTLPRLERLLGINQQHENHFEPNAKSLANVATLAVHCGLGGVFTKDVNAIWNGSPKPKPVTQLVELPKVHVVPVQEREQPKPLTPSTLAITTNTIANGRQWKIAGVVVSEVKQVQEIGHVATFHAGSFQFKTKGYSEYDLAANQCRSYVEGVLKMLKTTPR